ncbi:hypothetical protein [Halobacillus sp. BAB-2008]|uniref:hypothetical protein n=1 Tax=Halobacillus sp. BAB-2008 TaxID=1246484 RepID=UPI0002A5237B|nr:hypothetical protein [Halobacillus sp. BAB-2008]ELK47220.1 hypothetical protein D479_07212 [Halobacillus sp. BAB-2008]
MNELLEQLYDEMYSPKITPEELVKNIQLENYFGLNITKSNGEIIAETKCYLPDERIAIYTYTFDEKKNLNSLTSLVDEYTETLYDRKNAINEKYLELKNLLKENTKAAV